MTTQRTGQKRNFTNGKQKTVEFIYIERSAKLGLGTAYVEGFKWSLKKGYEYFFEMDADLSYDPAENPNFLRKVKDGYDWIRGSRYMNGTISVEGWDVKRLLLSKFANWYPTTILEIKKYTDVISGYKAYFKKGLRANKFRIYKIQWLCLLD